MVWRGAAVDPTRGPSGRPLPCHRAGRVPRPSSDAPALDFGLQHETLGIPRRHPAVPRLRRLPLAARASTGRLAPFLAALLAGCAPGLRPAPGRATVPAVPPAVPSSEDAERLTERRLRVPVAGMRASALPSTFYDARGERLHLAVDILAPRGTPVVSADDGRIWKLRSNNLGGITIYTTDPDERFVYYYAHLDHYRPGLTEGARVARGDTLGFVGTTGNAPPDVPHLHFQVARLGPDHQWWTGTPIDPVPFLRAAERGTPRAATTTVARGGPDHAPGAAPRSASRPSGAAPVLRPTVPALAADSAAATDSVLTPAVAPSARMPSAAGHAPASPRP